MNVGDRFSKALDAIYASESNKIQACVLDTGISQPSISRAKNSDKLSPTIKRFAKMKHISEKWLSSGEGKMFDDERYAVKNYNSNISTEDHWGNRLKKVREKNKYTQKYIAKVLGKDETQISRYEGGGGAKKMPRTMILDMSDVFTRGELAYIAGYDDPEELDTILRGGAGVVEESKIEYGGDVVNIPYYPETYASAGGGAFPYLANTSPMSFSKTFLQNYLGLQLSVGLHIINVVGDSMEPTLMNGELIFVNPMDNEGFRDGGIYVLMCGDTMLVKRVRQNPISKEYTLVSDNPAVEDQKINLDESHDCRFVGRVVGHMDRV